ncbi:MAG: hypothetical protein KJN71_04230 [Acidimicrobiia bacterium]|nr:hypothetical protein [Acidimicrobiia bacterium]
MTFPSQILDEIATELAGLDSVEAAVKRELRPDDPNCIVSVTGGDWDPEAYEIGKQTFGAALGPKLSFYSVEVAVFVKGLGEEDTYELRNDITREIRDLVETDSDLRNTLIGLVETGTSAPETVRMMQVKNQRNGTVRVPDTGDFAFYSLTELEVKVEA